MAHFATEEWADFARKRTTPEFEATMQAHLDDGCSACVDTARILQGVMELAGKLNSYRPSESCVRLVKALYNIVPRQAAQYRAVELMRLVFPAFPALVAEGLRASEIPNPHFLFQREDLLLDVQVEVRLESGRASMVGQLMDPSRPGRSFADRTITLMRQNTELARAVTNRFGEFHLEFKPAEDMMLAIDLEGEPLLVTPLPSFTSATTRDSI
jgi:hypothetical protein